MKRPSLHTDATLVMVLVLVTAGMAGAVAATTGAGTNAAQDGTDGEQNGTVSEENFTDGGNVTVVNTGENVTLDPVEGVTPQEPTVFLGPNATSGPNVTTGPNGTRVNVSQTYVLGGKVAGWQGVAPDSINGTVNPTLNLSAGQMYAITWINIDAAPHNVAITNQQDETVASTEIVSEEGAAQTLVFRVPDEPGTYYCEVHPNSMRGEITVTMNATTGA